MWERQISLCLALHLGHQMLKNLPAMKDTWVQFLGQEDPLEKEMAAHSRILAWRVPPTEEPGGLQSTGLQRVGHDWSDLACTHTSFYRGPQGHRSEHSVPDLELDRAAALEKLMACAPARLARMWWLSGRSQRQGETHSARCTYPAKQRCCTVLLTEICFLSK